jgi:hypothetical protein
MNYIHKKASAKTIIAAIYMRLKPSNSSWVNEAIEDIGWAIQGIGYHAGFINKATEPPYLRIANNRLEIPCDVERILHVEKLLPENETEAVLNPDGTTDYEYSSNKKYRGVRLRLGSDTSGLSLGERTPRTTLIEPNSEYYLINSNYLITSFTEGLIKLHYIGFDTDKDGLPKVIDDFNYKEAVIWFCIRNMILKGYNNPNINFQYADAKWEEYRYKAENAVKMMGIDGAERFRNSYLRAVRNVEIGSDFYMHLEQPEYIDRG